MPLNRQTIWTDTYTRRKTRLDGANIDVFTAIHYNDTADVEKLSLCAELNLSIESAAGDLRADYKLTAEQMEQLAAHLTAAASHVRELQAMLDQDAAEIDAAAHQAQQESRQAA